MKSNRLIALSCVLMSFGVSGVSGCSADPASPPGGDGTGGFGGALTGTGGALPGAGGAIPGGTLGAADAKITGSVTQCAGTQPITFPNDIRVPVCTLPNCQQGACITKQQVAQFAPNIKQTALDLLGFCGDQNTYCIPIDYVATGGQFLYKSCTSLEGLEGRCVSACIPQISSQLSYLPTTGCAPAERCAPCFDPRYQVGQPNETTPACSQGCDPGPNPSAPRTKFAPCGEGRGQCVPQALVPPDLAAAVPVADCTQPGYVCAPNEKAQDINFNFVKCVPSSAVLSATPDGPNGQRGGCVPKYLVDNQNPKPPDGIVMQDTCAAGELCAPCFNPISTPPNAYTGACPK